MKFAAAPEGLDEGKLEAYISHCEDRFNSYRQSQEKILLLATSLFTLLLSATGLLGATEKKDMQFGVWHLFFFDAALIGFWLLYLNRRLRGKLYSANLNHARHALIALQDASSIHPACGMVWRTLHGKEEIASTKWFTRWGIGVIFVMYCLSTTALLTTTLKISFDAGLAAVVAIKAMVLLPILIFHQRYRATSKILKARINEEWDAIRRLPAREA